MTNPSLPSPPTISDVLTETYNLVVLFDGREEEMRAWWTGTATGGFNADGTPSDGQSGHGGYYRMTNSAGVVRYFPCIDLLRSLMLRGRDAQTGINFSTVGLWNTNELLEIVPCPGTMTVDTAKVSGYCLTPPTADVVLKLQRNGVDWGTVTFHAGSHNQVTATFSDTAINGGDAVILYAPSTADATFLNFAISIPGVNS